MFTKIYLILIIIFSCSGLDALPPCSNLKELKIYEDLFNAVNNVENNINKKLLACITLLEATKDNHSFYDRAIDETNVFIKETYSDFMKNYNKHYYNFKHELLTLTNLNILKKLYSYDLDAESKNILNYLNNFIIEKCYNFSVGKNLRPIIRVSAEDRMQKFIYFFNSLIESVLQNKQKFYEIDLSFIKDQLQGNEQDFFILDTAGAQQEFAKELYETYNAKLDNFKLLGSDLSLKMFVLSKDDNYAVFDSFGRMIEFREKDKSYFLRSFDDMSSLKYVADFKEKFKAFYNGFVTLKKTLIEYDGYTFQTADLISLKVSAFLKKHKSEKFNIKELDIYRLNDEFNSDNKPFIITNFNSLVISDKDVMQYFTKEQRDNALLSMGQSLQKGGFLIIGQGDENLLSFVIYQKMNGFLIPHRFELLNSMITEKPNIRYYDINDQNGPKYGLEVLNLNLFHKNEPLLPKLETFAINSILNTYFLKIVNANSDKGKNISEEIQFSSDQIQRAS